MGMETRYYSSRGFTSRLRSSKTDKHHRPDPATGGVRISERRHGRARSLRLVDGGRGGSDSEDPHVSAWPYEGGILPARLEEERSDPRAGSLRHGVADGDAAEHAVPAG